MVKIVSRLFIALIIILLFLFCFYIFNKKVNNDTATTSAQYLAAEYNKEHSKHLAGALPNNIKHTTDTITALDNKEDFLLPPELNELLSIESSNLSNDEKHKKLVEKLTEYSGNELFVYETILSLESLGNPQIINDLLPLLHDPNEKIIITTISALSNLVLPSEEEVNSGKRDAQSESLRNKVSKEINQLFKSTESENIKNAIIQSYVNTNPSQHDTIDMVKYVTSQPHLTTESLAFLEFSLLLNNSLDRKQLLTYVDKISNTVKAKLATSMMNSLNSLNTITNQQDEILIKNFIKDNPPDPNDIYYESNKEKFDNFSTN